MVRRSRSDASRSLGSHRASAIRRLRPVWIVLIVATCLTSFQLPTAQAASTRSEQHPRRHWGPPIATQSKVPTAVMQASIRPFHPAKNSAAAAAGVLPGRSAVPLSSSPSNARPLGHPVVNPFDSTLSVYPGAVGTWAGSGSSGTQDGNGTAASFTAMSGVVSVGSTAYVATAGAIRTVDLSSGGSHAVGTIASTTSVFSTNIGGITTDGSSLYTADADYSKIWKTDLSTGATTALVNSTNLVALAYGGGQLYATCVGCPNLYTVDTSTGAVNQIGSGNGMGGAVAMTSDGADLWLTEQTSCSGSCKTDLLELDLSGAFVARFPVPSDFASGSISGTSQIASAGAYLYLSDFGNTRLERITKSSGAVVQAAGNYSTGYADGTGTDAWFSKITGIVSDGTSLWVADTGNLRFRQVVPGTALPQQQTPTATITADLYPGSVATFAGNGTDATVDSTNPLTASFRAMGGSALVTDDQGNMHDYIATAGSIRNVVLSGPNLGTVTTLTGSATTTGCTASPNPSQVRLSDTPGNLVTDGKYLYLADPGCFDIVRTDIQTGATSVVYSFNPGGFLQPLFALTFAGGYLYATSEGVQNTFKIDPVNGTADTQWMPIAGHSLTSDSQYLWATVDWACGGIRARRTWSVSTSPPRPPLSTQWDRAPSPGNHRSSRRATTCTCPATATTGWSASRNPPAISACSPEPAPGMPTGPIGTTPCSRLS
jgi:hypothetical protein